MYLYRTINSEGNMIDFYLSREQDAKAAKRFLKKALTSCHATKPRSITADGDKTYLIAIRERKEEKYIPPRVKKHLNKIIEQDYPFIKKGQTFQREKSVQKQMYLIHEIVDLTV